MTLNNGDMDKIKHIIAEITSAHKWYAIYPEENQQTRLRVTALRILQGKCKPETMQDFFRAFGYDLRIVYSVKKVGS